MAKVTYTFPYKINSDTVLSPQELDDAYIFGIDFRNDSGKRYSDEVKRFQIENAQREIENYLELKLSPQIIEEEMDFMFDDFRNWSYIRTSYPVKKAFSLKGFISDIEQIDYPAEWLSTRQTNDEIGYARHVYLVPGGQTTVATSNVIFNGVTPIVGYFGNRQIPNYWKLSYCTGAKSIPRDILDAIGKLASINVLNILGDIAIGAGLASQSIGLDGLSQALSTTQSAENNALSARVRMYTEELKRNLPNLRSRWKGITMTSL